jgi:hypothetical protein
MNKKIDLKEIVVVVVVVHFDVNKSEMTIDK